MRILLTMLTRPPPSSCILFDHFDHTAQILMCGPPPMLRYACIPALEELGFGEGDWFRF